MSEKILLSALSESESTESEKNFDNARRKKIREDFNELRYGFSKWKINEIRKNLYETKRISLNQKEKRKN